MKTLENYDEKIEQAAKNWLDRHPKAQETLEEIKTIIRRNNLRHRKAVPCKEFMYSGTIWCDECGWEEQDHGV